MYSPVDLVKAEAQKVPELPGDERPFLEAGIERPWTNGNMVLRTADAIVALGLLLKSWYNKNPQNFIPNIRME